jgi:hypothetical protein
MLANHLLAEQCAVLLDGEMGESVVLLLSYNERPSMHGFAAERLGWPKSGSS